jgi:iron-sulfur cluster repair protein YtfE (RIC family)
MRIKNWELALLIELEESNLSYLKEKKDKFEKENTINLPIIKETQDKIIISTKKIQELYTEQRIRQENLREIQFWTNKITK